MRNRLKQARREKGLTQQQAGALVGVSENSIYRYEAGTIRPSETALRVLAQVYGKPVEWFYGQEERGTPFVRESPTVYQAHEERMKLTEEIRGLLEQVGETLTVQELQVIRDQLRGLAERGKKRS